MYPHESYIYKYQYWLALANYIRQPAGALFMTLVWK